nr:MAG TPA: hypothetical protein [Caudoviricetes sp.]
MKNGLKSTFFVIFVVIKPFFTIMPTLRNV